VRTSPGALIAPRRTGYPFGRVGVPPAEAHHNPAAGTLSHGVCIRHLVGGGTLTTEGLQVYVGERCAVTVGCGNDDDAKQFAAASCATTIPVPVVDCFHWITQRYSNTRTPIGVLAYPSRENCDRCVSAEQPAVSFPRVPHVSVQLATQSVWCGSRRPKAAPPPARPGAEMGGSTEVLAEAIEERRVPNRGSGHLARQGENLGIVSH
jgi:hypothetical protein